MSDEVVHVRLRGKYTPLPRRRKAHRGDGGVVGDVQPQVLREVVAERLGARAADAKRDYPHREKFLRNS